MHQRALHGWMWRMPVGFAAIGGALLVAALIASATPSPRTATRSTTDTPGPAVQVVQGEGAVTVPPQGSVQFMPVTRTAGVSGPNPQPPIDVSSQANQPATVSLQDSLLTIGTGAGFAVQIDVPQSACQYGTDPDSAHEEEAPNVISCRVGPTKVTTITFSTIPYTGTAQIRGEITYPEGWNLIAAPSGTPIYFNVPTVPIYTLQARDTSYRVVPVTASGLCSNCLITDGGVGYWVYLSSPVTVRFLPRGLQETSIPLPPGQFVMIGNPGQVPVTVSGADAVYTYDPVNGYRTASVLQPGQGAWALSVDGGTASLSFFTQ